MRKAVLAAQRRRCARHLAGVRFIQNQANARTHPSWLERSQPRRTAQHEPHQVRLATAAGLDEDRLELRARKLVRESRGLATVNCFKAQVVKELHHHNQDLRWCHIAYKTLLYR